MNTTIAQMTVEELETLIHDVVREALWDALHDPDAGLELCPEFESRLRESQAYVEEGGDLVSLKDMLARLEAG